MCLEYRRGRNMAVTICYRGVLNDSELNDSEKGKKTEMIPNLFFVDDHSEVPK